MSFEQPGRPVQPIGPTRVPSRRLLVRVAVVVVILTIAIAGAIYLAAQLSLDSVAFHEEGLPGGRLWSIAVDGVAHVSSNATIVVQLDSGSHHFSASVVNGSDYLPYPASGSLVLTSPATSVFVNFIRSSANVTLRESGLPGGVIWTAAEHSVYYNSNASTLSVAESNGNHTLRILAAINTQVYDAGPARITQEVYLPNVSDLKVEVNGSDAIFPVQFTLALGLNWSRFAITVFPNDTAIPSPAYAYLACTFYRYTTVNVSFYGTNFGGVTQGLIEYLMAPSEFNHFTTTGNASQYVFTTGNVSQGNVSLNFVSGTWYFVLTGWSLDEFRAYTLAWLVSYPGAVVYFS